MKKIIVVTFLLLFAVKSYASQKAVTDTGEQVILNNDGTWVYVDKVKKSKQEIETSKTIFNKPPDSTFLLKSTRNNSALWINPVKWSFSKSEQKDAIEYSLKLKDKDLFGMIINEGVELPVESLSDIALSNAQAAAPDAKIVKQEYRIVNGKKILFLEMNGTIKGINFTYWGYYYSSPAGTTQLLAYTASSIVNKYKPEMLDFLNGLDQQ